MVDNNVQNVKFLRNGVVFTPSNDKTARQVALDAMEQQKENLADLIKRIETEVDNELKDVKMKEDQNDFMKRLQDA